MTNHSATQYNVTDLGALPHVADDMALGLNASGQVSLWTASPSGGLHAVFFSGGDVHALVSVPGYPTSLAHALNDRGQIVGWASTSANPVDSTATVRAFVSEGGKTRLLGTLGGRDSRAFSVNTAGQIVGVSDLAGGGRHAFLARGNFLTDLGTLPGGRFSQAYAINAAGHIAGVSDSLRPDKHAVLWRGGHPFDLGTLPGGRASGARCLNGHDQVAGYSEGPDGYHAFLYSGGRMQDLGTLGSDPSTALGINESGDVVGASSISTTRRHAFLWHNNRLADLNSLVLGASDWSLTEADAINDRGQIVCVGVRRGSSTHALLLTPNGAAP